jgi:hypothetical protein
MKDPAATLRADLRAKIGPESIDAALAALPPDARAEIKRAFEPRPIKTITRIRRKK